MATKTRFCSLVAAAALACLLAAQPAQGQVSQTCDTPDAVPSDLFTSIALRFVFPDPPSQELCEEIAKTEVKACKQAVENAKKCHDAINDANAKSAKVACAAAGDSAAQKGCENDVDAELASLKAQVEEAAAIGTQECDDLADDVFDLCMEE